ncbi:MAG: NADH-quinone oxidoreductase subunit J [Planctomycetota bacterium]|nr:NADH-quinone oxidoreductase subunit J [Planctomycetota bacterium]
MFIVFAGLAVLGGLVMAFHQSIVHSAFGLVGALFGVAGLYWTMGADFLGGLQVLLYVGGVTVLLLFAVMLSTRDSTRLALSRYVLVAPVVGLLGMFIFQAYRGVYQVVQVLGVQGPEAPQPTTQQIGELLLSPDGYLVPFELVAVLLLLVLIGAVTIARRGQEQDEDQGQPAGTESGGTP